MNRNPRRVATFGSGDHTVTMWAIPAPVRSRGAQAWAECTCGWTALNVVPTLTEAAIRVHLGT